MDPESIGSTVVEAEPPLSAPVVSTTVPVARERRGAASRLGFRVFAGDLGVSMCICAVTTDYGGYAR